MLVYQQNPYVFCHLEVYLGFCSWIPMPFLTLKVKYHYLSSPNAGSYDPHLNQGALQLQCFPQHSGHRIAIVVLSKDDLFLYQWFWKPWWTLPQETWLQEDELHRKIHFDIPFLILWILSCTYIKGFPLSYFHLAEFRSQSTNLDSTLKPESLEGAYSCWEIQVYSSTYFAI